MSGVNTVIPSHIEAEGDQKRRERDAEAIARLEQALGRKLPGLAEIFSQAREGIPDIKLGAGEFQRAMGDSLAGRVEEADLRHLGYLGRRGSHPEDEVSAARGRLGRDLFWEAHLGRCFSNAPDSWQKIRRLLGLAWR